MTTDSVEIRVRLKGGYMEWIHWAICTHSRIQFYLPKYTVARDPTSIIRVIVHTLMFHCKHRPQKVQEVLDNLAECPVPNKALAEKFQKLLLSTICY